jgi:hypothetical protein
MILATPFSSWPGGSAQLINTYVRTDVVCLFVFAATVISVDQIKTIYKLFAFSGVAVLLVARFMAKPDAEGRLALDVIDSTIGNPNDLAAHILLLLPFVLYVGFKFGNILVKLIAAGCAFYSVWVILGTSSRGALLGLAGMGIFLFLKATGPQRVAVLVGVPAFALLMFAILPGKNVARLTTLFSQSSAPADIADEAGESMASRTYLLKKSIEFTFKYPIVGVGPGQFSSFEGVTSRATGKHGNWHETHNSYTQVSSECGLPAAILMIIGCFGSLGLVNRTLRQARKLGCKDLAGLCTCYLISWSGYLITITFLACAYKFTEPMMVGLAVAIHFAAQREFAKVAPATPATAAPAFPRQRKPGPLAPLPRAI